MFIFPNPSEQWLSVQDYSQMGILKLKKYTKQIASGNRLTSYSRVLELSLIRGFFKQQHKPKSKSSGEGKCHGMAFYR